MVLKELFLFDSRDVTANGHEDDRQSVVLL